MMRHVLFDPRWALLHAGRPPSPLFYQALFPSCICCPLLLCSHLFLLIFLLLLLFLFLLLLLLLLVLLVLVLLLLLLLLLLLVLLVMMLLLRLLRLLRLVRRLFPLVGGKLPNPVRMFHTNRLSDPDEDLSHTHGLLRIGRNLWCGWEGL